MEEFTKILTILCYSKSKHDPPPISIFDKVLDLYNSNGNKKQDNFEEKGIQFSYKLNIDKFEINYNNIEYEIEKEPFIFYNEEKKILGKGYDAQSLIKIMKKIIDILEIYNEKNNKLKTKDEILNNKSRKFIIKEKNKFSQEIFNSLNSKRDFEPTQLKPITIPKSQLSPIPSEEFNLEEKEIEIKIILEKRNELITYINEFIESWGKKILIIYGCDGIGKSATFIYLSNLYNNYKVLYFNLKLIMKEKEENYDLFTYELMRYFTITEKNGNKEHNYKQYLEAIKQINKNNFNFWDELIKFLNYNDNNDVNETLLIIDQYKDIYDKKSNLKDLKNILLNKITSFKLLICFSVNNKSVKDNLTNELKYGSLESPEIKIYDIQDNKIYDNKDSYEKEIEESDLEKEINYQKDEDDGKFENILLFKYYENENKNKNEIKENNAELKKQINKNQINIFEDTSNFGNNKIEIIYINELISVKNIEDDAKYLELFDYNPKYYIKFKKYISGKKDSRDDLHTKFLKTIEEMITKKLREYYSGNKYDILKNESIVDLIKLKDLVDNKVRFTAPILVNYIKDFPMKYIKIKVYSNNENDNNNISNNFIKLNTKFKDTEFYFEFCFPFLEFIITKLIYMNENDYSVAYNKLSGSAKGSFIEQKIRKALILDQNYGKIILRYVWNFKDVVKNESKPICEYDFENYKNIYYDDKKIDNDGKKNDNDKQKDDNNKNKKIEIQNCVYYIVPGSQTNKNIDSALLIPDLFTGEEKQFKFISFQIKQGNVEIKNKREYINSSFIAKKKFEKLYNIKISKVFFYFILGKEFTNDNAITDLKDKKISCIFFSFIEKYLYQKDNSKVKKLSDLINPDAEIFQIDDKNEEKNLFYKICLINELENCLRKKSFLGKKITRNFYENGRKIFFKKDKGLRIKNEQREYIINFIKQNYNIKYEFTLKYVFTIKTDEFSNLNKYENLFGIYYLENNYFIIHQSLIFQLDINEIKNKNILDLNYIMNSFNKNKKKNLRSEVPKGNNIKLEEINNEMIYVFKIYYFKNNLV